MDWKKGEQAERITLWDWISDNRDRRLDIWEIIRVGKIWATGTLTGFHLACLQSKQLRDAVFERGIFWRGVIPCELESGLQTRVTSKNSFSSLISLNATLMLDSKFVHVRHNFSLPIFE